MSERDSDDFQGTGTAKNPTQSDRREGIDDDDDYDDAEVGLLVEGKKLGRGD